MPKAEESNSGYWRRLSDKEGRKQRQLRLRKGLNPIVPLLTTLGFGLFVYFWVALVGGRFSPPKGVSFTSFFTHLKWWPVAFIFLYVSQILKGYYGAFRICNKCQATNYRYLRKKCQCGGVLEPEFQYRWTRRRSAKSDASSRQGGES